jgi:hypothetical protein
VRGLTALKLSTVTTLHLTVKRYGVHLPHTDVLIFIMQRCIRRQPTLTVRSPSGGHISVWKRPGQWKDVCVTFLLQDYEIQNKINVCAQLNSYKISLYFSIVNSIIYQPYIFVSLYQETAKKAGLYRHSVIYIKRTNRLCLLTDTSFETHERLT